MIVPWMHKDRIAAEAADTISAYELLMPHQVKPPIPVEDMIERYLDLQIGFMDFEEIYGMKDVLGATFVESRLICVSDALVHEGFEGRLCFTYAHEIGHWVLHRKFLKNNGKSDEFSRSIFCRAKDIKKPVEWQADYFAACLLMPKACVEDAWEKTFGPEPLVIYNEKSSINGPLYIDPSADNWHLVAQAVMQAGHFTNVSKQAMMIRLQDLGLIHNKTQAKIGWKTYRETPCL